MEAWTAFPGTASAKALREVVLSLGEGWRKGPCGGSSVTKAMSRRKKNGPGQG